MSFFLSLLKIKQIQSQFLANSLLSPYVLVQDSKMGQFSWF